MPADPSVLRDGFAEVRHFALADVDALVAGVDLTDPQIRSNLVDEAMLVVQGYGEQSAALAADYYDEARHEARARGRFAALLAEPDLEDALKDLRWAVAAGDIAGRLRQKVDVHALQPGRDTIALSSSRDPAKPRWARVPMGKTCAFCLMTASRGAVYRSAQSAGDGRKFHDHCDCTPTPVWTPDGLESLRESHGYDPAALQRTYLDARDDAGSSDPKTILSKLREREGIR